MVSRPCGRRAVLALHRESFMSTIDQGASVAISYAWKHEREGAHAGAVQRFCEQLEKRGIPVRRDLMQLKPGGDIRKFMRSIGTADFLCVFLSDAYLESTNCMYELLIAWQHSRDDAEGFRDRVKVWMMPGMSALHKPRVRIQWMEHWRREYAELQDLLRRAAEGVSPDTIAEIKRIREIADNIEEMLAFFANTLSPQEFEHFESWISDSFPHRKKLDRGARAEPGVPGETAEATGEKKATVNDAAPGPGASVARPPWAEEFREDRYGVYASCTVEGVVFPWRWIPPGRFRMGSMADEFGHRDNEAPQHEVEITKGFWMGETPVTQAQWKAITGRNPSAFQGGERPVDSVNWYDCMDYIRALNQRIPGLRVALPSEAQWEYACRAGTSGAFHDGSACTQPEGWDPALDRLGWFFENSGGATHPVRQKLPNAWGLYDMHGNVWEWCRDAWDQEAYRKRGAVIQDPEVVGGSGADRVVRGGSWINNAWNCRAAIRYWNNPGRVWIILGLRLSAGQELGAAEPLGAERPAQGKT